MKRLFTLPLPLIAMLFSIACQSNPKPLKAVRTVIAGEVVNTDENSATTIRVNLCDPLEDNSSPTVLLRKNDWKFHVEYDYLFGQNLTIYYHNRYINLYVEPGDSIFIRIDAKELAANRPLDQAVQFSGDRAEVSRQIMNWCNYSYTKLPYPEFNENMKAAEVLSTLHENLNLRKDSLDAYAARNPMDPFVYDWALMDTKFLAANQMVGVIEDTEVLKNPIFDIQNPDNLSSMLFPYHLSYTAHKIASSKTEGKPQTSKEIEEKLESARKNLRILSEEFDGVIRDVALFESLTFWYEEDELALAYDSLVKGKNLFTEKVFEEKFEALVQKLNNEKETVLVPSSLEGTLYYNETADAAEQIPTVDILSHLTQRYPGKVLYIDVWFTTCPPCRTEIKQHAPALHEYYEGKEVVFVNLCVRSTQGQWLRSIKDLSAHGENYLLDEDSSSIFADEYKITSYPTYMLIDREGKLISNKASRPSELSRTIETIDGLL